MASSTSRRDCPGMERYLAVTALSLHYKLLRLNHVSRNILCGCSRNSRALSLSEWRDEQPGKILAWNTASGN